MYLSNQQNKPKVYNKSTLISKTIHVLWKSNYLKEV